MTFGEEFQCSVFNLLVPFFLIGPQTSIGKPSGSWFKDQPPQRRTITYMGSFPSLLLQDSPKNGFSWGFP